MSPRRQRRPGEPPTLVLTGIAGRLGRLVARRLHRTGEHRIVGIDTRPVSGLPRDIEHLRVHLRSKRARDVFRRGVDALVHLGVRHNPREKTHHWNTIATSRVLDYCIEYGVRKAVVLSSADVYGHRPDNQQFLGASDFPAIRSLIEVDMLASAFFWRAAAVDCEAVVLRPVHILGTVRNAPSNYLRLERPPVLMGFDPMVQVIHQLDLVEAIARSLQPGVHGVFNVTGPAEVPVSVLLRVAGKRPIPVPATLFRLAMEAMWTFRLTNFPVPELSHLRYVGMVDGARIREQMGFTPRHSLAEAVRAVRGGIEAVV